ncbi:tetratricopeptide repeat protein [uncultured Paraglaciecola sp.]|uniref:tetratricopeptide repeat protein n=1 Tax=uncultured Paraglaciecola sp. TaxID=1765024 RepID=UPI0030D75E08|tara:strand:- start:67263 stop:69143 length:1881 start_codon:yes stop_codon:yes gene_type:complete
MPLHAKQRTINHLIGTIIGLLYLWVQTSVAAERWKIVVLPDKNYHTPNQLPPLADIHSTLSQGLTIALTNADFDVLNLHYLGLPNCIIEDCSTLTDQAIRQGAKRSGKEVNLALLYQLTAFKQRQAASQKWYFGLSGRLLDLQSGAQQDAFAVDNWANSPNQNCIGDCLHSWLDQNLALLAQDLGAVLSEKLRALPRRFNYQLQLNDFNSAELQQIDEYLKNIEGYVADILLGDAQSKNQALPQNSQRTYQYISELTASELGAKLEKLKQQYTLPLEFEYHNAQRQFTLIATTQSDSWDTFRELITDLFVDSSEQPQMQPSDLPEELADTLPEPQPETDEEKEARRDQQMWQQADNINTLESYQQYLSIWPQGQHFMEAHTAIKNFQDDEQIWQQTLQQSNSQAFQQYLSLKPTGKYREQAKQQLKRIRALQQLVQKQQQNKALADDYYYQRQNYPEALYYYTQAATLGDAASQYLLGKMYADALGTELNMRQAANWYAQAANQGHRQAQATLGYLYSKGNGVSQDYSQAINWYQKAAEQGHINAQYNLAYLYSTGQGVLKNYVLAAYWYEKSAAQGDADAQNSLGKLYERGLGVNIDLTKAKNLYQQAAAQGNQIAQLNLQMLKN